MKLFQILVGVFFLAWIAYSFAGYKGQNKEIGCFEKIILQCILISTQKWIENVLSITETVFVCF